MLEPLSGSVVFQEIEDLRKTGRGERIRTSDLSVPNRALYQAEPRPDK